MKKLKCSTVYWSYSAQVWLDLISKFNKALQFAISTVVQHWWNPCEAGKILVKQVLQWKHICTWSRTVEKPLWSNYISFKKEQLLQTLKPIILFYNNLFFFILIESNLCQAKEVPRSLELDKIFWYFVKYLVHKRHLRKERH